MSRLLSTVNRKFPNITKLYSIGKSAQGRELWVMQISNDVHQKIPLKPNAKYVANMHGNEAVGREMMLHLIAYLVNFSNKSANVKKLLHHTNIHILPSLNPDGFERSIEGRCEGPGRKNSNGIDLNRNFPDRLIEIKSVMQPETLAIKEWLNRTQFVLSANIHGGALVVNYPFDGSAEIESEHLESTPDHDVFLHLAMTYAKKHPKLKAQTRCRKDDNFENGITNGNAWYPVQGSMQDYNYIFGGCMELTLEISCCKHPNATNLLTYWNENKISMLALLNEVNRGVKGVIRDYFTEMPIAKANLTVLGRDVLFQSDLDGQFWRLLLPGDYVLIIKAQGYSRLQKQFTILPNKITIMELYLVPLKRMARTDWLQMAPRTFLTDFSNSTEDDLNEFRSERLVLDDLELNTESNSAFSNKQLHTCNFLCDAIIVITSTFICVK
ncbi:hypothetical protein NH340_JMT05499 [Sarcoptes scabiei]|nr:hypothetical protein NH340_JMT05499 [Sarcoptes scabiei]